MDVSITSEAFEKLRADFNKMMIETLNKMREKGSTDASLTIKLEIGIEKTFELIQMADGTEIMRDVYLPQFAHKITSAMQIKSQIVGKDDEECELIYDSENQTYQLVPIGQIPLSTEYDRTEDDDE